MKRALFAALLAEVPNVLVVTPALRASDVQARIREAGAEVIGGAPAEFGAYIGREIDRWRTVVAKAGIKPERGR